MKRFHTECTDRCTEGLSDGYGGIGGKAAVNPEGFVRRDCLIDSDTPCTIISIGDRSGCGFKCVIEVADEYESKMLAAGLKPVAEVPESDEAFVKRHFPTAWSSQCGDTFSVRYFAGTGDGSGPDNWLWTIGHQHSRAEAWAQAAKEVREHLATQQPPAPAPRTKRFHDVSNGYAKIVPADCNPYKFTSRLRAAFLFTPLQPLHGALPDSSAT